MNINKNQDKGFTLVELLIVIVILGILATVTVFAVSGITDRGQQNACAVEKRALETATEAYFVENSQTFPTTLAQLETGGFIKDPVRAGVWSNPDASGNITAVSGGDCA